MKKAVIICVDDEKVVLNSLKVELRSLLENKYTIEVAENGAEAIEIVEELIDEGNEIPLVISDYIMPNMKGDELLIHIHKLLPYTLKVLLTGQASIEGVTKAVNQANLYRYISKPWEPNDMLMTIKEAINSYYKDRKLEEQNRQLIEINATLEQKVIDRTKEISEKNDILQKQKNELDQKNRNIISSIQYAKRIQSAMLPACESICSIFPESFVFYQPKDIVSGDFYWIKKIDSQVVLAAADCTGHGVPGALMGMLGISLLNEIVPNFQTPEPSVILDQLRDKVKLSLKQTTYTSNDTNDGMDIALCIIDLETLLLKYSGAFSPFYIISNDELFEYKANKQPVAAFPVENPFSQEHIQLKRDDVFYIFSDGFADQLGGAKDRRFLHKNFKKLLLDIHQRPFEEQKEILEKTINDWKGDSEQLDDIMIIGVKVG